MQMEALGPSASTVGPLEKLKYLNCIWKVFMFVFKYCPDQSICNCI